MKNNKYICRRRTGTILMALYAAGFSRNNLLANPVGSAVVQGSASLRSLGSQVSQGSATYSSSGTQFTIQAANHTVINWQSFNIGAGETTTFVQPSSSSVVWNTINDPNPSQILGNLNANGYVVLQNPSGFYIGGQAVINTHGLTLTTSHSTAPDLSSGGAWEFDALPPTASIINYGQINISGGSSAFLIAHDVENHGTISAPQGSVGLYAGQQVLLSERPDGRGLSATVTLPEGSVDNSGNIIADGGTIAMRAQVVNQGGLVQANSVQEVNGVIELVASGAVNLGASSIISAQGDSTGTSQGGNVTIKSDNTFSDQPGSAINVSGGIQGGNGGNVEISAASLDSIQSTINGQASTGFTGGTFTIDPVNITLTSANLNTFTVSGFSGLDVVATGNITVGSSLSLNAATTTETLALTAGNNINVGTSTTGYSILAPNNWNLTLTTGTALAPGTQPTGANDAILLNSSSTLQTQNGNIILSAPGNITVNGGAIRTMNGGTIIVTSQYGDVNSGNNTLGYSFAPAKSVRQNAPPYYTVSTGLGGISTAAGGDVTISAGRDVLSYLPVATDPSNAANDAGSGAFGTGNVTITAGRNISGHYVLANGVGTITDTGLYNGTPGVVGIGTIGVPQGVSGTSGAFALSLVKGSWNVSAPKGSIYIQDIRNPNGVFNDKNGISYSGYHLFDYDPSSSVTLNAFNRVEITGDSAPHGLKSAPGKNVPFILPPSLTVNAGAGGFVLDVDVTLFPSPNGELNISTTKGSGGGFSSYISPTDTENTHELSMSDSGATQYDPNAAIAVFSDKDHASTPPPELNNPNPVVINIDGTINNVIVRTTKATEVTVSGDAKDFNLLAENLHATDHSFVNVAGSISYSPEYTFTSLSEKIFSADPALPSAWDSIFSLLVNPGDSSLKINDSSIIKDYLNGKYGLVDAYAFANVARIDLLTGIPLAAGYQPNSNPGFIYDSSTGILGYTYKMSPLVLQTLSQVNISVLQLNQQGHLIVQQHSDGNYYFATTTTSFATPLEIAALYASSQKAIANSVAQGTSYGFQIGGPGFFKATAQSIDLGSSGGIVSYGVLSSFDAVDYSYLQPYTTSGAEIEITTAGDISLLSSRIASIFGGNVNVASSSGSIGLSLGNFALIPGQNIAYGIWTSGLSDVNVTAYDDVNIGGARIATFNGGNTTIVSENGNVNAGNGANSVLRIPVIINGVSQEIGNPRPFGSGVVAIAPSPEYQVSGSSGLPGNITITTPNGNIVSTLGGIQQFALDGSIAGGPTINLTAGSPQTKDAHGNITDPGFPGNVDLGQGGVIGGTVNITAYGSIEGLILSRQNANINAVQNFTGTLLAGGIASVSATSVGSASTIIGVGAVNISGTVDAGASVLGQNVSVGGAAATSTLGAQATATSTATSAGGTENNNTKQQLASDTTQQDDLSKKHGGVGGPALTKRGRVQVLLPKG